MPPSTGKCAEGVEEMQDSADEMKSVWQRASRTPFIVSHERLLPAQQTGLKQVGVSVDPEVTPSPERSARSPPS